mmetsp:Transcript_41293/g.89392  ORF Transcript_41293/g.89392 Transcript_41293/m.89392 type:complete len:235 (-) Transcript_41293:306-1010(-)
MQRCALALDVPDLLAKSGPDAIPPSRAVFFRELSDGIEHAVADFLDSGVDLVRLEVASRPADQLLCELVGRPRGLVRLPWLLDTGLVCGLEKSLGGLARLLELEGLERTALDQMPLVAPLLERGLQSVDGGLESVCVGSFVTLELAPNGANRFGDFVLATVRLIAVDGVTPRRSLVDAVTRHLHHRGQRVPRLLLEVTFGRAKHRVDPRRRFVEVADFAHLGAAGVGCDGGDGE